MKNSFSVLNFAKMLIIYLWKYWEK